MVDCKAGRPSDHIPRTEIDGARGQACPVKCEAIISCAVAGDGSAGVAALRSRNWPPHWLSRCADKLRCTLPSVVGGRVDWICTCMFSGEAFAVGTGVPRRGCCGASGYGVRRGHGRLQDPAMVIRVCAGTGVGWRGCSLDVVTGLNTVVGHCSLVVVHFSAGSANSADLEVVLGFKAMTEVTLHVYDVTNSMNVRANSAILGLNRFMRGGIGIGGIFHGAVEVYNNEWSFGYCESGTGVFTCQPKRNPMYTYRESLSLGRTELTRMRVEGVVQELSREWPGVSYDLLSRNCNHFCDSFCVRLGVQRVPLWVNRFANAGDAAFEAVDNTMARLRQAKEEVLSASRSAMQFMFGSPASSSAPRLDSPTPDTRGNTNISSPQLGSPSQPSFKSSPSSSHDSGSGDGSVISSDCDDDDEQPPPSDTLP